MKKFITVFLLIFVSTFLFGETLSSLPKEFQSLYQRYSYSGDKGKTTIESKSEPGIFIITEKAIIFKDNTYLTIKSVDKMEDNGLVNYIVTFKYSKNIWVFNSIENYFTQVRVVDTNYKEVARYIFRISK